MTKNDAKIKFEFHSGCNYTSSHELRETNKTFKILII